MGKALVLIGNNLKYDTRVKRHIQSIAEVMDSVYVLARPIPDEQLHLSIPNVSHSFFHYLPQSHPIKEGVLSFKDRYELREAILTYFFILGSEIYLDAYVLIRLKDGRITPPRKISDAGSLVWGQLWIKYLNHRNPELE